MPPAWNVIPLPSFVAFTWCSIVVSWDGISLNWVNLLGFSSFDSKFVGVKCCHLLINSDLRPVRPSGNFEHFSPDSWWAPSVFQLICISAGTERRNSGEMSQCCTVEASFESQLEVYGDVKVNSRWLRWSSASCKGRRGRGTRCVHSSGEWKDPLDGAPPHLPMKAFSSTFFYRPSDVFCCPNRRIFILNNSGIF